MGWCPKCRIEYREGFTECSDCKSKLVEVLEEKIGEPVEYDHEMYLTTVSEEIEADVMEALLKSSNIPVLRKYRENGAYLNIYMGNTSAGIDIFVPSKLFDASKELIDLKENEFLDIELQDEVEEDEFREEKNRVQKSRSIRAWVVLLLFIPGLVFTIMFAIKVILLFF